MNVGVTARLTAPNSAAFMADHPALKLCSIMAAWKDLQPVPGALNASALASLDRSIGDAHDRGHQLIVRVPCGVGSPAWLEKAAKPVRFIDTLSNDPNPSYAGTPIRWPVPWDPNLGWWHRDLLVRLTEWAGSPCPRDPSHKKSAHIHSWPLARPTEDGTEMTLGYGRLEPNRTKNRAAWDRLGSQEWRRMQLKEAWWSTIVDHLAANMSWSCSLAGGALFEDGQAASNDLLARIIGLPPEQRDRVLVMVTNLSQADKWPHEQRALAEWLDAAAENGVGVGLQFAGTAILPANDLPAIRSAVEYATDRYGTAIRFFEAQPGRLTGDIYDYLLGVQKEMQPPRFQVSELGGVWYVVDGFDVGHFAHFHGFDDEARAVAYGELLNGETDG